MGAKVGLCPGTHTEGWNEGSLPGATRWPHFLWQAAHESYVRIVLDVGIQPVSVLLARGQHHVVALNH